MTRETTASGTATFRWEPVDEPQPDDARRRRRVRALIVACVVGALAIVTIAVVATRVVVREAHKHERPRCLTLQVGSPGPCLPPVSAN